MSRINIEKIGRIKSSNTKKWLALEGVIAIGIGKVSSGMPGVIITVNNNREMVRSQIPDFIDGIPIEVQQSGTVIAL